MQLLTQRDLAAANRALWRHYVPLNMNGAPEGMRNGANAGGAVVVGKIRTGSRDPHPLRGPKWVRIPREGADFAGCGLVHSPGGLESQRHRSP
ncbi:hypothetical protein NN4_80520 [Nocardia ninae NBRC 108245]|uniref:Uncharacterized protein n=1 Tax=Nocardia ninae NBRC 108245 TaxID=1210091 RepID=A0A511MSH2_9NOCA|nr:hypothetical protein NN4_80520 [Nocardia ninae NBRC 108245]